MEDNSNNNQNIFPSVSETPITNTSPAIEEVPVTIIENDTNNMEIEPKTINTPSEIISIETPIVEETIATPETPVSQTPITNEPLNTLEVRETPVNTYIPVSPNVQEIPEVKKETTINNVENNNEISNISQISTSVEENVVKKKNFIIIIPIILIVLCLIGVIVYFLTKNNNKIDTNPTNNNVSNVNQDFDVNTLSINQVYLNGVVFSFPETKTPFNNIGWIWEESFAKIDVDPGTSTNGGRIGTAPGGASVMVYNNGTQSAHVEDCEIYNITFYNPKDGSENALFIGGLGYTSSLDSVKNKMKDMGFDKVDENTNNNSISLKYYFNNDKTNQNSYIEFNFNNNTIESVTISTNY